MCGNFRNTLYYVHLTFKIANQITYNGSSGGSCAATANIKTAPMTTTLSYLRRRGGKIQIRKFFPRARFGRSVDFVRPRLVFNDSGSLQRKEREVTLIARRLLIRSVVVPEGGKKREKKTVRRSKKKGGNFSVFLTTREARP